MEKLNIRNILVARSPRRHSSGTHGDIAERVLACADDFEADLLVIAAERKAFRNATVIGPNAERFVRFATCPVLTISQVPFTLEDFVPEEQEAVAAR